MANLNERGDRVSQPWTTKQLLALSEGWAFVALEQINLDQAEQKESITDKTDKEVVTPRENISTSDQWSPEKLIRMSNHIGLFYTGL
jgi:hypothetical protein